MQATSNFTHPLSDSQTKYQAFLSQLNNGTLNTHFDSERLPRVEADCITFYLKPGTPPTVTGHLAGKRLADKVAEAICAAWGNAPRQVAYEVGSPDSKLRGQPNDLRDGDIDDYQGVYHTLEEEIIQPERREYNQATQYYRKKWRPLLGPTLSELVRELRQRCHYNTGRNKFDTTYKSLAADLGVSEPTIKRALQRDKIGDFKNEYLHYFIADIQTIRETNGKGEIRTKGTRFLIYLNDTLTPDDRAKPPKDQIDT